MNEIVNLLNSRLATLIPAVPTFWENVNSNAPVSGVTHIVPAFLPADNVGESFSGAERADGIYQVLIRTKKGAGPAPTLVDSIKALFPAGLSLKGSVGTVRVGRFSRAPALEDDTWYSVPLSIRWTYYKK